MKKTLAAVLAAAMALSTATVAFAKDIAVDNNDVELDVKFDESADYTTTDDGVEFGKDVKGAIQSTNGLTKELVGDLLSRGLIKIDVSVVSGRSYLAAAPTVKAVDGLAQLKFKINHTYGTKAVEVGMKIRITALKDIEWYTDASHEKTMSMSKGDTLTGETITFKAEYKPVTAYGEDMTLTKAEVNNNFVLAKGEALYDNSGDGDKVTIYFDNFAAYSTKISAAQKDVNLYYTVDDIADVTDAFPDVDFEFITFKGTPSFSNRGTMTFNAIGGKDTKVYSYANGELTKLEGEYDSTYGIVTVDGIKTLSTFVVASEALEVEEEPAAPSTPAVEEANPNTGAC